MSSLADDILYGAAAIGAFMGLEHRQVTHLRESDSDCPIRKRPGLELYAFRSELEAWLKAPETLQTYRAPREA